MRKFAALILALVVLCMSLVSASAATITSFEYGSFRHKGYGDTFYGILPIFDVDSFQTGKLGVDFSDSQYTDIVNFFNQYDWFVRFTGGVSDSFVVGQAYSYPFDFDFSYSDRFVLTCYDPGRSSSSQYAYEFLANDPLPYVFSYPFVLRSGNTYVPYVFYNVSTGYIFRDLNNFVNSFYLDGDLNTSVPVPPDPDIPEDFGPAKVQWTSWGNKVSVPPDFISMLYPVQTTFNLYTGNNEYHTYGMYCEAYDKDGVATGDIRHIPLPVGNDALPPNYTYQIYIRLNSHVSLKKGINYAFTVYDKTTGDEISTIGVKCGKNIFKIPGIFNKKDTWSVVEGDAFSDTPLGDGIVGSDGTPTEGISGTEINPPVEGAAGSAAPEDSLLSKLDSFVTSLTQLPGYLARSIESLSSMGQQIGAFFGAFFVWLPVDMRSVFLLGITLIVVLAVIKFIRG